MRDKYLLCCFSITYRSATSDTISVLLYKKENLKKEISATDSLLLKPTNRRITFQTAKLVKLKLM